MTSQDFTAGIRAADDDARLCARKLRVALQALEQIAERPAGAANGESVDSMARRTAAQNAIQRIGELR